MENIKVIACGLFQANAYIITKDKHALVIDPGTAHSNIFSYIEDNSLIVDGIFLTHAHFDHIGGVDKIIAKYNCPLYMNEYDAPLLTSYELNCSLEGRQVIVKSKPNFIKPGLNKIGDFDVEIIDAPGHSEGCSMLRYENNLFTGDVLFKNSIGRTDLKGGSNTKMNNSLKMIRDMEEDYVVYPGHGEATTLKEEKENNPYL